MADLSSFHFSLFFLVRFIYDNNVALRLFDFALSAITLFLSQKFFLKHIWLLYLILNGNKTFLSDTKAVEGLSEWPKVHFHIRLKPSKFFQSLNHVDINLKPRFLIKSGYYIVPSPSTALSNTYKSVLWTVDLLKQKWIQNCILVPVYVTSDARYFIVKIKCHCDFIIVYWANSYFKCIMPKSLKWSIVSLCISFFENMRADFVLRYQKLTSQSTPEIMHLQTWKKKYLNQ